MLTVVCLKIVIPQTDCYVPSYTPVTRLQDKKITIPRVICPSDFSSNTFAPSFALANWLDARLIPDGTTCITIIGHRGKHILSQSFSDHYKRTLLKFAGCHLRAQSPTSFPMNTKSLCSKDFSDPLTSIARRRGTSYILRVLYNPISIHAFYDAIRVLTSFLWQRRMWDLNPRMTSLPSDGFQDRSLKPDLGNPPQNQSKSVFSLGRWSSQIPMTIYNRTVLRTIPSTPTRRHWFGHKSVHSALWFWGFLLICY